MRNALFSTTLRLRSLITIGNDVFSISCDDIQIVTIEADAVAFNVPIIQGVNLLNVGSAQAITLGVNETAIFFQDCWLAIL